MNLCIISPRFFPVIGGLESYLTNIAKFCSNYIETTVITSNLKSTIGLFEKFQFLNKFHEVLFENLRILRIKASNNLLLKQIFNFNEFLNNRLEYYFDKYINPTLYGKLNYNKFNEEIKNLIIDRIFIYQRLFENPNFLRIFFLLQKMHKENSIDIIHSAPIYLNANVCAFLFSKKFHIPFVCTPLYHINPYAKYIFYPSYQRILEKSAAIIAFTKKEKTFYQKFGINKKKIHIIPPGIEPDNYKKFNVHKFKDKHSIGENAPILLFLARRAYEKGFIQVISALKYLIKKFENIKLIIAGPMKRDFLEYLKKIPLNLKNHILDLGFLDESSKLDALASCDVFVLPSLADSFGIVYLEAWLFKKPVIGALEGNVEGLIDNNINGFLVPFNNVKALASKITILLKDEKLRIKMGQNGYNKVMNNFLLENTNNKLLNLYKQIIK